MTNLTDYKEMYKKVQQVINSVDPVGLVSGGAPEDEYDSQVNKIITLLQTDLEIETLTEEIHKIFIGSFGEETAGDKAKYLDIAEKVKMISSN